MRIILLLLSLLIATHESAAQTFTKVKDVIASMDATEFDGRFAFLTNTINGSSYSLCISDGTEGGTVVLSNTASVMPTGIKACGGRLYFLADDGNYGPELWVSDGNANNTGMVKDINPSGGQTYPNYRMECACYQERFVFTAEDGMHGREVWISDGTNQGTVMLKDIAAGTLSGIDLSDSGPSFAEYKGDLYFFASSGTGKELWRTSGSETTTVMHTDQANTANAMAEAYVVNGRLVFTSETSTGYEVYTTEGSSTDVARLSSGYPAISGMPQAIVRSTDRASDDNGYATSLFIYGGRMLMQAGADFYLTDGTAGGTTQFLPGFNFGGGIREIAETGNVIYFVTQSGDKLYGTDGVTAQALTDLDGPYRSNFHTANGRLYFVSAKNNMGYELYVSDGTPSGTDLLKDIYPGNNDGVGESFALVEYNGRVYFGGRDGGHGLEMWATDGTGVGTVKVSPPSPIPGDPYVGVALVYVGCLYVNANYDNAGTHLWKYCEEVAGIVGEDHARAALYPNPSNGRFKVSLAYDEPATVEVTDALGMTIHRCEIGQYNNMVDIIGFGKGIYSCRIRTPTHTSICRIVLE